MMITNLSTLPPSAPPAQAAPAASTTSDPLANKQIFLQLLVSQLKHQDPLQPQDGTQFITQLAQFSQLEQSTQIAQGVTGIEQLLAQYLQKGNGGQ